MAARGWAHITKAGEHGLRRGSWYEVVDDAQPDHVVIRVNGGPVRVPRACVERHADRPLAWTVVLEIAHPDHFGRIYAVCPDCVTRAAVNEGNLEMECPGCGFTFPIDWSSAR